MAALSTAAGRRLHIRPRDVACWCLVAAVTVMVLWPVVLILAGSFNSAAPGQPALFGLAAWRAAFSTPGLTAAIWNTLALTAAREAVAFPLAIVVAWLLARTDMAGSRWLEFLFWIAFFLPALPVTQGARRLR